MKKTFKILGFILLVILILPFLFWKNNMSVDELKPKYANENSNFIDVLGMQTHYRVEGIESDSVPIVLIHGTGASLHTWQGWIDSLKQHKKIITFDLPAFGLTGPNPTDDYSIDLYVKFTETLLKKLGTQKIILGGNSLGGSIAWNYALKNPNQIEKLILVDAGGPKLNPKSVPIAFKLARIPVLNKLIAFITPRSVIESSIENVYVDDSKVTNDLIDRYMDLTLREGNRDAFVKRMNSSFSGKSNFEELANFKAPTLLMWGKQDLLIPIEVEKEFERVLPNESVVIYKNLGHVPMEEDPAMTVKDIKVFLKIN